MTRLLCGHIEHIGTVWPQYEADFRHCCGQDLWQVALATVGLKGDIRRPLVGALSIAYGEGIIGGFAQSLQSISEYLGFPAILASDKNFPGWAELMAQGAEIILCSDDTFYGAFNLKNGKVGENSEATGLGYAQMLLVMAAERSANELIHVIGAGPVGQAGARHFKERGHQVIIHDLEDAKAAKLAQTLGAKVGSPEELREAQKKGGLFFQAAPDPKALDWSLLSPQTSKVAHPAVPLGLSVQEQKGPWAQSLWHDPLELGTAVMLAMAL